MKENNHYRYMKLALSLARKGLGRVSPNPMVGAVLVKGGRIVGKGYHRRAGFPHAEIEALRETGAKARGAALYVTLEPCAHWGKTPPCTDALIRAGVKEVVFAMRDPNPLVNGKGVRQLKKAGSKVTGGIMEKEARKLNEVFVHVMTTKLPFVTVKIAQSLDGKIATRRGESKWITGESARQYVRRLRSEADAILAGITTVLKDDPALKHSKKIILDPNLKISTVAKLFTSGPRGSQQIIVTSPARAKTAKAERLKKAAGCAIWACPLKNGQFRLHLLFQKLVQHSIHHLLVEGGGETIASLFEKKLVNKVIWFIAPKVIGGRRAPTSVSGEGIGRLSDAVRLKGVQLKQFDEDLCIEGEPNYVQRNR